MLTRKTPLRRGGPIKRYKPLKRISERRRLAAVTARKRTAPDARTANASAYGFHRIVSLHARQNWRLVFMESHQLINQSSGDVEIYTPPEILDPVRALFGGEIAIDPASSEAANRNVRAKRFFTA